MDKAARSDSGSRTAEPGVVSLFISAVSCEIVSSCVSESLGEGEKKFIFFWRYKPSYLETL